MDQTATKADLEILRGDLHRELHALTWKMFAFGASLVAAVYGIARYVK
ncbi:MAG: hypothetical protein MO847_06255 [Candidatus Protistobacter heckmanni]|nr:hypothetical protein [Candidatus Protistobacter heckmanni]